MAPELKFTEEEIQKIFGHEAAEDEQIERLKQYYFKSAIFEKVAADLPLRIVVGHKGIGKSALFKIAMQEQRERAELPVLIRPDDIVGLGAHHEDFLGTIRHWKQGLQEIIAEKVLGTLGLAKPGSMEKAFSQTGKLLNFLRQTLSPYLESKVSAKPAQVALMKSFLDRKAVTVYVDDLDRGWDGSRENIARVSALLNALRDLCNDNIGLKFKLSLRSDVYFLVRTSDESTDKVEGSVVWFAWTNHEILALLVKRKETFCGTQADQQSLLRMPQHDLAKFLNPVMDPYFTGEGKWENAPIHRVLMSLVRKRPRDLVKLCTLAARQARDRKGVRIATVDWQASFEEYSQGRVQDTINEFRSELPEIERLIMNMKPNRKERQAQLGYTYKTEQLMEKLRAVMELGRFTFRNGSEAGPKDLAQFLYKINFLTARKELPGGEIDRKYFEENR